MRLKVETNSETTEGAELGWRSVNKEDRFERCGGGRRFSNL